MEVEFGIQFESYLEPFFGSGAVLFNKPRSHIETVNDLDGNAVNLFDWINTKLRIMARNKYSKIHKRRWIPCSGRMPENNEKVS